MKKGEQNDQTGNLVKYPKVDFKRKGYRHKAENIVIWLIVITITAIIIASQLFLDLTSQIDDSIDSEAIAKAMVTIVFLIILLILARIGINEFWRFLKSGAPNLLIEFSLSVAFAWLTFCIILMINVGTDDEDTILFSLVSITILLAFIQIIAPAGIVYVIYLHNIGNLMGIYPQVIASAERATDEYLDGYSERPYSTKLDEYNIREFLPYIRFLMRHILIYDYVIDNGELKLIFPKSARIWRPFDKNLSWMRVKDDGTVTVFITPKDYNFMKVPISYHLLCEKVVERIAQGYDLFAQGKKKSVLEVFRVEKVKKTRSRKIGSKRDSREQGGR